MEGALGGEVRELENGEGAVGGGGGGGPGPGTAGGEAVGCVGYVGVWEGGGEESGEEKEGDGE